MSFWGNASGEKAEIVEDIKPIPAKTLCKCMFEEVVYAEGKSEYGTNEHVKGTLVVIDGEYKNRKIFVKLHIDDDKQEKAELHRDALMRLFLLTKTPVPESKPSDGELMALTMKPLTVRTEVWEMNDKKGNWVSAYYPADYTGKVEEKKTGTDTPAFNNPDDEIPF
jgi:hypothetical protein